MISSSFLALFQTLSLTFSSLSLFCRIVVVRFSKPTYRASTNTSESLALVRETKKKKEREKAAARKGDDFLCCLAQKLVRPLSPPPNKQTQGTSASVIHPASIVLAATGTAVESTATGSFVVKPVRGLSGAPAALFYDPTSGEISYGTSSARYKTDVEAVTSEEASAVLDLRPVSFRAKADSSSSSKRIYGFIAEEVAAVDPLLVYYASQKRNDGEAAAATGEEEVIEGVHYERVAPLLRARRPRPEGHGAASGEAAGTAGGGARCAAGRDRASARGSAAAALTEVKNRINKSAFLLHTLLQPNPPKISKHSVRNGEAVPESKQAPNARRF